MKTLTFYLHPWQNLISLIFLLNQSFALNTDGILLLSFKYYVLSDPNGVLNTWSYSDETPCSWHGVRCDAPGRVTGLSLPNSQIIASVPDEFGSIQFLKEIDLSNNSINGTIPLTLFNSSTLEFLDFSNNLITGELSELAGGMKSLRLLNLSDNELVGEIRENISSLENLTILCLKNNYLSGNLPSGFDSIQVLDLSSNFINGSLPVNFSGKSLKYFNISHNNLSGKIPHEFSNGIPRDAILDLSFNNFTGEIPGSDIFVNQNNNSFVGNPGLCGKPLIHLCNSILSISNQSELKPNMSAPSSPPAIAAIPKTIPSNPATGSPDATNRSEHGLRKGTIIGIIVGDVAGLLLLTLIFIYIYHVRQNKQIDEDESSENTSNDEGGMAMSGRVEEVKNGSGHGLVTVDGEKELELETLLKASAYILGASRWSIMYRAVLEDGRTLAVRRIGESGVERFRDFENQVRVISKLVHPNLVRIRGFYWGPDEKLVIYDYVPNGSLVNARYRKVGSSPCPLPWEMRFKIAKGVARGLAFIHEKKHVHANLKPSNILLESDMEPKIGDFGLERLVTGEYSSKASGSIRNFGSARSMASRENFQEVGSQFNPSPSPSSLNGVSPYYAPESLRSLKPNPKWDVYSFGIIFLELLTGKVVSNPEEFGVEDKSRVLRLADVAIRSDMEGREDAFLGILKLGFNCISLVPQNRPTMKEVVQILDKFPSSNSSVKYYGS